MLITAKNKFLLIVIAIFGILELFVLTSIMTGLKVGAFSFEFRHEATKILLLILTMFLTIAYVGLDRETMKTLICPHCKAENRLNAKFCDNCGASFE